MMIIHKNYNLASHNTLRLKSICNVVYIPENVKELKTTLKFNENISVISSGSNIILRPRIHRIILLSKLPRRRVYLNSGVFYFSASVKLSNLVTFINKHKYGGIENLYGVPGTVGGAIYMNAGSGNDRRIFIGDFIKKVFVTNGRSTWAISRLEAKFSYRYSIFHDEQLVIIGAIFKFNKTSNRKALRELELKRKIVTESQDYSSKSVGSFFNIYNYKILRLIQIFTNNIPFYKGIKLSKKHPNWLINAGKGTYYQVLIIVFFVRFIHTIFNRRLRIEAKFIN